MHTSTIAIRWYAPVITPYAIGRGIFGLMAMLPVYFSTTPASFLKSKLAQA